MEILDSSHVSELIHNLVHQGTQQHQTHLDLTAKSIHRLTNAGSADFGGSEFQPAQNESVAAGKKNPDDDYGWWHLSGGNYQISFNESIGVSQEQMGLIVPHHHLHSLGVTAGPLLLTADLIADTDLSYSIQVPNCGCHIKENARVASLIVFTV